MHLCSPPAGSWASLHEAQCSPTHTLNCATSQAAINSPSAILKDTLVCILLLWAMGALFQNTSRPPHCLCEFGSVTLPESEISNLYSLPPFQVHLAAWPAPIQHMLHDTFHAFYTIVEHLSHEPSEFPNTVCNLQM